MELICNRPTSRDRAVVNVWEEVLCEVQAPYEKMIRDRVEALENQ